MANRLKVEEYLKRFVTEFVITFEKYFSEYYSRFLKKMPKKGDWRKLEEGVSHLARTQEGDSDFELERSVWIIGVFQKMAHSVGVVYPTEEFEKVPATLVELKKNPSRIRQTLLESAATIFQSFEYQFIQIEFSAENWCDFDKIVHDAVNRVIYYYQQHPGTDFKCSSVTTALILGESQCYSSMFFAPRGHTITVNSTHVDTKDLFEKVGLERGGGSNYQIDSGLGCRLAFDWEQSGDLCDFNAQGRTQRQYQYCADQEMISRVVGQVSENIYAGSKVSKFEKTLQKISQDAERGATRVWELIEDNFFKVMKSLDCLKEELDYEIHARVLLKEDRGLNQPLGRVWFDLIAPIGVFVGRYNELMDLQSKTRHSSSSVSFTAVCGLNGIGKTQLVRRYTYMERNAVPSEFFHIIWLNAENERSLMDSFLRLATYVLNTHVPNEDVQQLGFIMSNVYKFLSSRRTLIVFDNVENTEYLKYFLPPPTLRVCISIILISQRNDWDNDVAKVNISRLQHEDAKELVEKSMESRLDERKVNELVEELHHFPLAISMAVGYIKQCGNNMNSSIDDFLNEYRRELSGGSFKDLTSSEDPRRIFVEIVFNISRMSYRNIQKEPTSVAAAVRILNMLAFLSSENLNYSMFYDHFLKNVESSDLPNRGAKDIHRELEGSLYLLTTYAFVEDQMWQRISINSFIQEVIRLQIMASEKLRQDTAFETFQLLQSCLTYPENVSDIYDNRRLLPHLKSFLFHISTLKVQEPERNQEAENLLRFLKQMGKAYERMGESAMTAELYEAAFRVTENYYGKIHFKVAQALATLANVYGSLGRTHEKKLHLENALKIQEEYYGTDTIEMTMTLNNLGNAYGKVGEYNKMVQFLERVLSILEKTPSANHSKMSIVLYNLGVAYSELGNHKKQRDCLEKALQVSDPNVVDERRRACMINNLGNAYGALGDYSKQVELYETALDMRKRLDDDRDNVEVARSLHNLGTAYGDLGDHERKTKLLDAALEIELQHYGENHIEIATTLYNLGIAKGELGDHEKKKELLKKSLEIEKAHYGEDNFKLVITQYNLAICYRDLGYYENSKNLLLSTLKIQEEHFKDDTIAIANTLCSMAGVYSCLGNYSEQVKVLKRALQIQSRYCKPNSMTLSGILDNLGGAYGFIGEYNQQKELYMKVLGIRERHFVSDHPDVARTMSNLGNTNYFFKNYRTSKQYYETALRIEERLYNEEFIRVARILNNLGSSFSHLEDNEKAKEHLERSLAMKLEYYGKGHNEVSQTIGKLASVYRRLGEHLSDEEIQMIVSRPEQGCIKFIFEDCSSYCEARGIDRKKDLLENALIIEDQTNPDGLEVTNTIRKLGNTYGELGNHDRQVKLLERALSIQENHYDVDNIDVSRTLFDLGEAYGCLGDNAKRREVTERALVAQERDKVDIPNKLAATLDHLGHAYGLEGNLKKQKEVYDRSLSIKRKHYGTHHYEVAKTLNNLGNCSYSSGDYHSATELYKQALTIQENLLHDRHIEIAQILNNLGCCFMYLNNTEEAKRCLEKALAIKKGKFREVDVEITSTVHNLGNVYYKLGDHTFLEEFSKMYGKYYKPKRPRKLNHLGDLKDYSKANENVANITEEKDSIKKSCFEAAMKLRHLRLEPKEDHESETELDEIANSTIAGHYNLHPQYHLTYFISDIYPNFTSSKQRTYICTQ